MNSPLLSLLKQLWYYLSKQRRIQFISLFLLMIITSLSEIVSIGSMLPFITVLTNPVLVFHNSHLHSLITVVGITEPTQLMLPLTIVFGVATIISGAMRLLLLGTSTTVSFLAGADLSSDIYRKTLYQSYQVHVSRNSSEIIDAITSKASGMIYNVILPLLNLASSVIIIFAILIVLMLIQPVIALTTIAGFGLIYLLVINLTRERLLGNSKVVAKESTYLIKSIQEGLGGIRDIIIDNSQETYCKNYKDTDSKLRAAQSSSYFLSSSPRFIVESLGMLFIGCIAYLMTTLDNGFAIAIPLLATLALGAQRLLPVLQLAYNSWSTILSNKASLVETLEFLNQTVEIETQCAKETPLLFEKNIVLNDLSFRYTNEAEWIIRNLNLSIKKGQKVGFIGETGCGKSTLLDIIMGLLAPKEGCLLVDGEVIGQINNRAWQSIISHVPQSIFLADSTIAENIAFGVQLNEIDILQVKEAAKSASLSQTIESWPHQYQTIVGERGIRLSGGQRQRIGIARALYKKTEVIVLDEATSALDIETEQEVMQSIDNLGTNITILIIAHRLSTLKNCDMIVDIGNGKIKNITNNEKILSYA